jgi:FAD/FMN-containing dehydrogenase
MPAVDLPATLRELVGDGHVVTDPDVAAPYAQDWTRRWQGKPLAVVRPGNVDEVAAVVRACAEASVSLVPQGGNTGLVGAGVPQDGEVVLSLRRLNAIGPLDPLARTLTAAAGATLSDIQRAARAGGLDVGIDFAARDSATIGGIASTNAGGERVLRHGVTRTQVLGLEAVLADGSVIRRMSGLPKDNTGYDLVQLLVGSEGTLGVITAVQLRLVPTAAPAATALVAVKTIDDALSVLAAVRQRFAGLDAAEYFHDDGLQLVLRHRRLGSPFDRPHPLYLLVEVAGTDGGGAVVDGEGIGEAGAGGGLRGAAARASDAVDELAELLLGLPVVRDAVLAGTAADRRRLWELREAHTESISAEGVPVKLDVALPLSRLGTFEQHLPDVVREVAPRAVPILFGHIAEGNVHVNLLAATQADAEGAVTDAVLKLVASLGGSISAEHGIGLAKRRWMPLTREPADLAAMRAIKHALDPAGILSPGRILA